jgi:hypothetical protein
MVTLDDLHKLMLVMITDIHDLRQEVKEIRQEIIIINKRLDAIEHRLDKVEVDVHTIQKTMVSKDDLKNFSEEIVEFMTDGQTHVLHRIDNHEGRITKLEALNA